MTFSMTVLSKRRVPALASVLTLAIVVVAFDNHTRASATEPGTSSSRGETEVTVEPPPRHESEVPASEADSAKGYNVLLISLDALRADHLSCYGYWRKTSPWLDRFAEESVLFTDCMVQLPYTEPSHITMLTGLHPVRHGVKLNGQDIPDELVFLSEVLAQHDYQTYAVVSAPFISKRVNFDQGFELFRDLSNVDHVGRGAKVSETFLNWLRKRDTTRPFFAFLHFYDIHEPYGAPGQFENLYCEPGSDRAPIDARTRSRELMREWDKQGRYVSDPHLYHYIAKYDEGIAFTDQQLGKIFAALDSSGLSENTIVLVTADHGQGMGDFKNDFRHGQTLYQNTLHVPLLIRVPWLAEKSRRVSAPVCTSDIPSTIVDLLQVPDASEFVDGHSLKPFLEKAPRAVLPPQFQSRARFARSGGQYVESVRYCTVRDGVKSIRDNATSGRALWKVRTDIALEHANRLRVFFKARYAVNLGISVRAGEREELKFFATFEKGRAIQHAWEDAFTKSEDGWIAFTTPIFNTCLDESLLSGGVITGVFMNLGVGCKFEGFIDDIQIERDGNWLTVESFEEPDRLALTRTDVVWPKSMREYELIAHRRDTTMVHEGQRAEYIHVEFPLHPFGHVMYNLNRDPFEKINVFSENVDLQKELERRLFLFLQEASADLRMPQDAAWEVDDEMEQQLRALGYLN